jgi:hypothetical protein
MAQLPNLIYDQKPPMSSDSFKALAETLLNERDAALMKCLSLDPDPNPGSRDESLPARADSKEPSYNSPAPSTGNKFIDGWREWERTLRINLAKNRAHILKRENEVPLEIPVVPMEALVTAAKATSGEQSPLDAELLIDKARWNTICGLAGSDYFSRENVFAYYLKLVMMERKDSFDTEKGFAEYKSLYASILESANKSLEETS